MKRPQAWGAGGLTHQAAEETVERGDTWLPPLVGTANVREAEKLSGQQRGCPETETTPDSLRLISFPALVLQQGTFPLLALSGLQIYSFPLSSPDDLPFRILSTSFL